MNTIKVVPIKISKNSGLFKLCKIPNKINTQVKIWDFLIYSNKLSQPISSSSLSI